jgi:PAS domain S-box-containing protein
MTSSATRTGPDSPCVNTNGDPVDVTLAPEWRRVRWVSAGIIAIGVAILTLLWSIIIGAIHTERDAAIEHARNEANNLSAAFQAEVQGRLNAIVHVTDIVAAAVRENPHLDLYVWARANPLLMATPMQAVAIVSADGTLRGSTQVSRPGPIDLSDRNYFLALSGAEPPDVFISRLKPGRLSGEDGLRIARRITAADGRFLGLTIVRVQPTQLTGLPASIDLGPRDYLTLIGTDNVMRARFGADSTGGEVGVDNVALAPVFSPPPGARVQSYIRQGVIDHRNKLYSVRKLDGYPLYASVGLDLGRVLAPVAVHARLIVAVGVVAAAMLGGLMTLLIIQLRRLTDREVRLRAEQGRLAAEIRNGLQIQARLGESEARLSDYAKVASDWFWEQDADLRFVRIGVESPFGTNYAAYVGKRRWELGDTSQAPDYWAAHQRDVEGHQPFKDFRYNRPGADRKLHDVAVSGVPVFDEAGAFAGYRGTGRDITAEVAAERELHAAKTRAEQAETLLRDAVDSMSEGFVIYDREDRLVMCNDRFRQLYGRGADQIRPGTKFVDLIRGGVARGEFVDAIGGEARWRREREQQLRECKGSVERQLGHDRWILVTDRRMRSGGLAGLRVDITALKRAQAALRDSEVRLDRAQAIAGIGSWELDVATGRYTWSKELYRIRGVTPEEFSPNLDNIASFVHPDDFPSVLRWLMDLRMGVPQLARDTRIIRPDGEERVVRMEGRAVADPDGYVRQLAGTMQDITERRLMERQLLQAQKMEAIGNLTGGMAHDFNNGLGVIIGNLDLLARYLKGNADAEELCQEVRGGALRCTELVRGLLAFARRQPLLPQRTDVNALIEQTIRMLDRTLGQDITLTSRLDPTAWPVLADPVQLEAAMVNLATNARDAMPYGGQLEIATRNIQLDAEYAALYPEVDVGAYVLIEVSDTGSGIPPEIVNRIFEPFFTTKPPGQGSGLGLSMVFGFTKQSGGHLTVYSELGRGSTFRIYLPQAPAAVSQEATQAGQSPFPTPAIGGYETVLMVEDNEHLRRSTARQLTELGYQVIDVPDAEAALPILESQQQIDLLFSDVVMPGGIDGVGLARRAVRLRPKLRILLTSGLLTARSRGRRDGTPEFRLLSKPYQRNDLAGTLREMLDPAIECHGDADQAAPLR